MKNDMIIIDGKYADGIAAAYFSSICGFDRDEEKYSPMLEDGLAVREKIRSGIKLRAVMSSYGSEAVCGRTIELGGTRFECKALEQLNRQNILGLYAYILTAGNVGLQDSPLLEAFYADTWGTAYIDAGRDILRTMVREDFPNSGGGQVFVSDSFGPGYYGMDIAQVRDFFEVLEGDKIGVELTGSGLMLPIKSCAGFYIIVDEAGQLPGADCRACLSNAKGCSFCRMRTKKAD